MLTYWQFENSTFFFIFVDCAIQLDKKSKLGKAAGLSSKKSFLISLFSAYSANHGNFHIFSDLVNAEKASLILGLDSKLKAFLIGNGYLDVYGDYLKYQRIKGIDCVAKSVGDGVTCTETNASGKTVMGVLAPIMAVLGLYLN